jgi:transcriptional regulator with XRE-family HTH domain
MLTKSNIKSDSESTAISLEAVSSQLDVATEAIDGIACRGARAMLGISQAELCERAVCSRSSLNDFENGLRVPRAAGARRIKEALVALGAVFIPHGERFAVGVRPDAYRERTARARSFAGRDTEGAD